LPFANVPNPFAGLKVEGARPSRYVSQIDAGDLLRKGREELAATDGEAYKALLLALGAGLRKSEIDNLQWQQIDDGKSVIRIMTTASHATKTADSEGAVFVDAGLIAELLRYRDSESASLYVLASNRAPNPEAVRADYRAEATFDRLTAWLRAKGIATPKPLHDLRREFGSIIAATSDIYTASRQLRHSNIATTAAYYLDNRRRVAPAIGDMLAPQPEAGTTPAKGKAAI
jgi:integrase